MTRSPPASTYDDDFFAWTQEQAAALRRVPAVSADIDLTHVAEEIEDLGKRDLREVKSYLARLLEHLVKIDCYRQAREVPHWRGEALNFQTSALEAFSPGMRRLIDMPEVWRLAAKRVRAARESGFSNLRLADHCPLTLDELLSEDFDVDTILAKLAAPSS